MACDSMGLGPLSTWKGAEDAPEPAEAGGVGEGLDEYVSEAAPKTNGLDDPGAFAA